MHVGWRDVSFRIPCDGLRHRCLRGCCCYCCYSIGIVVVSCCIFYFGYCWNNNKMMIGRSRHWLDGTGVLVVVVGLARSTGEDSSSSTKTYKSMLPLPLQIMTSDKLILIVSIIMLMGWICTPGGGFWLRYGGGSWSWSNVVAWWLLIVDVDGRIKWMVVIGEFPPYLSFRIFCPLDLFAPAMPSLFAYLFPAIFIFCLSPARKHHHHRSRSAGRPPQIDPSPSYYYFIHSIQPSTSAWSSQINPHPPPSELQFKYYDVLFLLAHHLPCLHCNSSFLFDHSSIFSTSWCHFIDKYYHSELVSPSWSSSKSTTYTRNSRRRYTWFWSQDCGCDRWSALGNWQGCYGIFHWCGEYHRLLSSSYQFAHLAY